MLCVLDLACEHCSMYKRVRAGERVKDGARVRAGVHDRVCLQLCLCAAATGVSSLLLLPEAPSLTWPPDYSYLSLKFI